MLTRVAELAREWQLDSRQAFDTIKHSAVIDALFEKQVPLQLIAVLVAWWSQSEVSVRVQSVSSHRKIRVQRGVPQGAPESPLVFVMTTDCALGSLQPRWQSDAGWSFDSPLGRLWVSCLAYAFDILVFARTELALTQMIGECCAEFGKIGLEVVLDKKTFWSSSVDCTGRSLVVNGVSLPWSRSLEFLGNVFDLCGHSGKSARNTVDTKRIGYSVVGPQSSPICRCPFLNV